MVAGDQRLVHTPFVPSGYWSPCAPLVCDPVKAPDVRFSSSHFRKQHPRREKAMSRTSLAEAVTVSKSKISSIRTTNALTDTNLSILLANNSPSKIKPDDDADDDNTSLCINDVVVSMNNTPTSNNHKVEEVTQSEVTTQSVIDLKSFDIQLSSVQPHSVHKTPLTLYPTDISQKNDSDDNTYNIQLTLHYANNKPHPEVMVFVAVISSRNVLPITEINVRFGVEKPFKIRQLIASGQNLPSYTTFLPPASISQVLLIYNPSKLVS
ncbi:unnamed protein product [Schistosoma margrebowiei]|uniref:Uncharacterized protein n=1 Tax=Schistosoma margrebowiei TaxID=48269 RepID=A0A183M9J1_9TREM|nr:unnamed protein product [Schistosoma margrebowiei]